MAFAPLGDDMAGHADQVRFRVTYLAKVRRAQEPKIRLLCQVFDVDRQADPPSEKPKQIPVPSLAPARNEEIVGHHLCRAQIPKFGPLWPEVSARSADSECCRAPEVRKAFRCGHQANTI